MQIVTKILQAIYQIIASSYIKYHNLIISKEYMFSSSLVVFALCVLYSSGLRPLQFSPGPLSCLHNSKHYKIPEQGKGTDDHLLPLGDWL